jgi:outer membrane protein TolC
MKMPSCFPKMSGLILLGMGLSSCVSDTGFDAVRDLTKAEIDAQAVQIGTDEQALEARQKTKTLLRSPLSAKTAVQVALLNNRSLQASYNELGLAQSDVIRGSLPANPRLSITKSQGSGELEIEREVIVGLYSLLTLPMRASIAQEKFKTAQMRTAESVLRLSVDVRRQYLRAVAAQEQILFLEQAKKITDAQSDLAKKLGETGALNKLDQARDYAQAAELDRQLAIARLNQKLERERLTRLMGLWGADINFTLPAKLPALPTRIPKSKDIEAQALERRVDLIAARHDLEALALSLGLMKTTQFISDADLVGRSKNIRNQDGDHSAMRSLGLEIEIPLFDFGAAKTMEAENLYMRSANLLADKAINIRSQTREAYAAYQGTFEIARHMEKTILPLRDQIQQESLLHYNGMLKDLSAFIADLRMNILAQVQFIEAKRNFFMAETEMRAVLIGGGSGVGSVEAAPSAPSENAAH